MAVSASIMLRQIQAEKVKRNKITAYYKYDSVAQR